MTSSIERQTKIALLITVLVLAGIIGLMLPRVGASSPTEITNPQVVMEVLDPSLEQFALPWRNEIARRFPHAVGLLVHGGDFVQGQWIVGASTVPGHVTTVADQVERVRKLYPDRTIVLLACNTGHLKLGIPGVFYAQSSVWCVPDRGIKPEMLDEAGGTLDGREHSRWDDNPDVVGNIFEFVKD